MAEMASDAGKPLKAKVDSGGAPLIKNSDAQPEINLMCGPGGPAGVVSLDNASSLYNVSKIPVE